jgi:hypothetical protein
MLAAQLDKVKQEEATVALVAQQALLQPQIRAVEAVALGVLGLRQAVMVGLALLLFLSQQPNTQAQLQEAHQ